MKRKPLSIFDAAKPFRDAFTYDPGHSDLDNEQPINITVTLGDWRKLHFVMMEEENYRRTVEEA